MKNLANEIRPMQIDQLVGQNNIKKLLKEVVKNNLTTSFLFFGESGIGKTSAAFALANEMGKKFGYFNATVQSKKELVELLDSCEIIIIDEIHRLNKDKQDILLSYLEFDKIIVYATTTENPYFKVNPAVRSRMQVIQFSKLSEEDIVFGLRNIIDSKYSEMQISDNLLLSLARQSSGDFRMSINNLQMLYFMKKDSTITENDLKIIIPNINFYSDMNSSSHYNNLSAFHKSLRGSDPHAALYYGMLILKSGDIDGLFRRMLCVAYEDIGLANPNITLRVKTAIEAFERLGLPEGKLPIAFAIIDLCLSVKSNSVIVAIDNVEKQIETGGIYEIPKHLRDAHYASAAKLGDGIGYKYPHNYVNNWVDQEYLPKKIHHLKFYIPQNNDMELKYQNYWKKVKNK